MKYKNIEPETHYGDVAVLKTGRTYREKYRTGHGSNGKLYRLNKRAGKIEAKCQDCSVPMSQFLLIARTMADMDKLLGRVHEL